MTTTVVNIKHTKEYDVYIGRSSRGMDGAFGNPFIVGKDGSRVEVVQKFRDYFLDRIVKNKAFRDQVLSLKDRTLACFCVPLECHGNVIAEWLDNIKLEEMK